ncbi:MAG: DUF2155 domain-containing protein [Candidatus Magnetominusculus sp. LBB02]|nr:DUF2155 domain-containing protein [Candidatus Magnetominusculus sp. LBB02]
MVKYFMVTLIGCAFAVLVACSDKQAPAPEVSINQDTLAKQKQEAQHPVNRPDISNERPSPHQETGEKHQLDIVVPENVRDKWQAVKFSIRDKKADKTQTVTVQLGSEYTVAGTSITIKPTVFLPDFKMDSHTITSVSAELNNPAVNVVISDTDKELFKGWLYSKYPDVHPFEHDTFAIILVEAVRKG